MDNPRFRVLLIGHAEGRDVPPPLSFWFLNRTDADMVADLSRGEAVGVAVLDYPESGPVRVVRFEGEPAAQAWLQTNLAFLDHPSVDAATLFTPSPERRSARSPRDAQVA